MTPLEVALHYAALGLAVFPLYTVRDNICTCTAGRECDSSGKHPRTRNGVYDATTARERIAAWWTQSPDANIGIATGAKSGIDVLDVDHRHAGDETLFELERQHGDLPATCTARTQSGGAHLFFRHADGIKNLVGLLGSGLDLKTTGGYVAAAPSVGKLGPYSWVKGLAPGEIEPAAWPDWLLLLARSKNGGSNGNGHAPPVPDKIPQGERNKTLMSLAGSMRRRGCVFDEIFALLKTANTNRCDPPLTEPDVRKIAESARKYPPAASNDAHPKPPLDLSDADLLTKARSSAKFARLFDGDWDGAYSSPMKADFALCCKLAFWTGRDASRIDELFRQSGMYRSQWEQGDYRQQTIAEAISRTVDVYDPFRGIKSSASFASSQEQPKAPPDLLLQLLNDTGNADRLIAHQGHDMRYCHATRKWMVWDGCRWKTDESETARALAVQTILEFLQQAIAAKNEPASDFAKSSLNSGRISNMLREAQPHLSMPPAEMDQHPYLLNFTNGTVDLKTGELQPHRREDAITKLVHFEYDPEAECPLFLETVTYLMGGDADPERAERLVNYSQRAFGYSLTGVTDAKAVFIPHGGGDNGKTTLLALFARLLEEYSAILDINTLMTRVESNNTQADLADLRGARFVRTSETEEGQRLAEGKLKRITQGMGKIKSCRKYENPIEFLETHKLWMDANHRPEIRGSDDAIWNRLHLIPFDVTIPKDKIDRTLPEKLYAEATGILAWAVKGAKLWLEQGLAKPKEVETAASKYREEQDRIRHFI
jgi:P4 family phage/plasmid primase-like protien